MASKSSSDVKMTVKAKSHVSQMGPHSTIAMNQIAKKKKRLAPKFSEFARKFMLMAFHTFLEVPAALTGTTFELRAARRSTYVGLIRTVLGTQQPIIRCRTGLSNLTTTAGSVLQTVIQMDSSGVSGWSSFAALFDEYRVRKAILHVLPGFMGDISVIGTGTGNTQFVRMVVDYDDATAIASSTAAMLYDTGIDFPMGSHSPKVHKLIALPEGQPDLAWVTTATPSVPFWFKFYNLTTGMAASVNVGIAYIEVELEFRALG
jgi:hypothetical protein